MKTKYKNNTRGSEEANHMWENNDENDLLADQPAPTHTKNNPLYRRLIAYTLVTVPVYYGWLLVPGMALNVFVPESIPEATPAWTVLLIAIGISLVCTILAEGILRTQRRLVPG